MSNPFSRDSNDIIKTFLRTCRSIEKSMFKIFDFSLNLSKIFE